MNSNKALFLDRDGVINEDLGFVFKIKDFKPIEGIDYCLKMICTMLKCFQQINNVI